MFKRILTATDGSECAQGAVAHAVALARGLKATVIGISVVDVRRLMGPFLHDLGASVGFANVDSYQPQVRAMLTDRATVALDLMQEACAAQDVTFERVLTEGKVVPEVVEHAKSADLVVMGKQGEHAALSHESLGSTVESVVRHTNRPVLLCPATFTPIQTALAAYDGSPYAYGALKALAEMAKDVPMKIHLLAVADTESRAAHILAKGQAYLRDCDIEAEVITKQGHPEEVIAQVAQDCHADLIAMGAYGHSRIRELVVGSTTEHIMRQCTCAFLVYR